MKTKNMKFSLDELKSSLSDLKINPDDLKVSLDDIGSKLHELKLTPDDLKTRLDDLKLSPDDLMGRLNNLKLSAEELNLNTDDLKKLWKNRKFSQDDLFRLANVIVLPFWLLMLLLPNTGLAKKIMSNNFIFMVMGGLYTGLLVQGISQNPNGIKDVMNPSLDGITKLLSNRQSAFTGWMHFITFDLFVARWIYFDSLERGKAARFSILLTFLAGPAGLLFYLIFARQKKKS